MYIIFIDSGTTNTRIRLVKYGESTIIDVEKVQVGVRNTAIDGNNLQLKKFLRAGLESILLRNKLEPNDIKHIVASGMITSNLGVYEVPHIIGPAYVHDFTRQSRVIKYKEFFNITWIFIPGFKNTATYADDEIIEHIDEFDIMRGEEVEVFGLLNQFKVKGKGIVIIPGSHTKFVFISEEHAITSCLSTLGGETLFAIQNGTILSSSMNESLIQTINQDLLKEGFNAARKHGLTRSFYHVRLLQMFSDKTENERANYFVGSVISEDLKALYQVNDLHDVNWVIIGGSDPLRVAFKYLIDEVNTKWNIFEASDEQMEKALIIGAQKITTKL